MLDVEHKDEFMDSYLALLHHRGAVHFILQQLMSDQTFDSRELVDYPQVTNLKFEVERLNHSLFTGKSYAEFSKVVKSVLSMPLDMQRVFRYSLLDLNVSFSIASNIKTLGLEHPIALQFIITSISFCYHFDYESIRWMDEEKHKVALDKMIDTIQQSRMEQTAFEELDDLLK